MRLTGTYNLLFNDEVGTVVVVHAFQGVTFFNTFEYYGPLTYEILPGKVSCFSFFLVSCLA